MVRRVKPQPEPGAPFQWRITDHACRACMGRVLSRTTFDHKRLFRCANCGIEREGGAPSSLCCCGIRFGKAQRDAGIRCVPNPQRTPECMSEIVAMEVLSGGKPAREAADDEGEE